jgi:hypothetical protein
MKLKTKLTDPISPDTIMVSYGFPENWIYIVEYTEHPLIQLASNESILDDNEISCKIMNLDQTHGNKNKT